MSDDLDARFVQAADEVTKLSKAPESATMLQLYALYKQGTNGDCDGARPGMLDFVKRAKYDAWKSLEGTSHEDAKTQYIELVEDLKAADAG